MFMLPKCGRIYGSHIHPRTACNRNMDFFFQSSLGLLDSYTSLQPRCLLWWDQSCKNPILRYIFNIAPQLICWFLWKARNSGKFNSKHLSSSSIILSISKLIISCVQIQFRKIHFTTFNWIAFIDSIAVKKWKIQAILVPWISASTGYTLNSDGSSMQNATKSSGGGILRNPGGKLILAYSFFFGQGTNMCAESLALLVGLFLCEKIQVSNITVRCDSKILADMLNGKASIP